MASSVLFIFAFVFVVIGGLELLDRTFFALIAFSSKHPAFQTWAGAATAFLATTTISVAVGGSLEAAFHRELEIRHGMPPARPAPDREAARRSVRFLARRRRRLKSLANDGGSGR